MNVSRKPGAGYHVWTELEKYNSALAGDADISDFVYGTPGRLNFDDIVSGNGGVNGASENCLSDSTIDCVYDLGQVGQ